MKNIKLITIIALSLLAVISMYFFYTAWDAFNRDEELLPRYRTKALSLMAKRNELKEQRAKARERQRLLREFKAAGLNPSYWRSFPVAVGRDLSWDELKGLLMLTSHEDPFYRGYYFKPSSLKIIRPGPATEDNAEAEEDMEQPSGYQVEMAGTFLLRK